MTVHFDESTVPRGLDREAQRNLLVALSRSYPGWVQAAAFGTEGDDPEWLSITSYLAEHGLVETKGVSRLDLGSVVIAAKITAAGLDFLQHDGGPTAILGVVTVRMEAETLKALLAAKVDASDLSAKEKSKLKTGVQNLSSEALAKVSSRLMEKAIENWPLALEAMQRALA